MYIDCLLRYCVARYELEEKSGIVLVLQTAALFSVIFASLSCQASCLSVISLFTWIKLFVFGWEVCKESY